ncbi:alpha amylase family protein [Longitalea luteola]|uniref:alpha amylase family protein n=1 Tax=Longitalea luteola TaxID=2812563 RepID=UPI001A963E35|nr:alpha amylase family protein [Longitalea luteola]
MKLHVPVIVLAALVLSLTLSCKKSSSPGGGGTGGSDSTKLDTARHRNVLVWIDCRANVYSNSGRFNDTNKIKLVMDTMQNVGVTGLVLDVKGSAGYTMYPSAYAKQYTSIGGISFTPNVDYVEFMIREAHKRNFKIYASTVTFVEGDASRGMGTLYDDAAFRSDYESIVCDVNGNRVPITSTGRNGFVNPAQPAVQERALNIVKEIATKYNVDGIILDYARYADIYADFSDFSKAKFIEFLKERFNDAGAATMKFPGDIVASWKTSSGVVLPNTTGKYYQKWLLYRSSVIYDFFKRARAAVKAIKPNISFGVYVGAWYGSYYQVGVNWASQEYDPFSDQAIRFDWAYPKYNETGYAEQLDILMTGNYFTQIMLSENSATANLKYHWWSIEGSLNGIKYVTKNKVPLYGSIDMGNLSWSSKSEITRAIKYILNNTSGGIMLFDVVHAYAPETNMLKQPLWDAIAEGIKK